MPISHKNHPLDLPMEDDMPVRARIDATENYKGKLEYRLVLETIIGVYGTSVEAIAAFQRMSYLNKRLP